jgi:hypothetical protein
MVCIATEENRRPACLCSTDRRRREASYDETSSQVFPRRTESPLHDKSGPEVTWISFEIYIPKICLGY